MNRLYDLPTLRIDDSQKLSFRYLGKTYYGLPGDTLATAMYANGIRIFSRSLKYHRPRGLYSLDGESSNTYMEVDGVPNVCTERTLLKDDMLVKAQNVKGSANFDWMAFIDKLDWMMPAGFYYKTMHKPPVIWPMAMKAIRKAAGLGTIGADTIIKGNYDEIFLTADVCVIGGGAAGMKAALTAAQAGVRVVLLESRPYLGGYWDYRQRSYDATQSLFERSRELARQVEQTENIRVFKHAPMVGAYSDNLITAFQVGKKNDAFTERYIEIRSKSVVVATGCIERPLIFEHNERPGVMQIACAHRLARTYGVLPGREAVFSVGHDLGLEAAIDLYDLGMKIGCIADIRLDGHDPELLADLDQRGIPVLKGWVATKTHGCNQIKKITLSTIEGTVQKKFSCDLVVASAGLTPVCGPLILAQAKMAYDNHTGYFLPKIMPADMFLAGRALGVNHPQAIEASGELAGLKALRVLNVTSADAIAKAENKVSGLPGPERGCKLVTAPVKGRRSFICFDEDTTIKNIKQAMDSGFDMPELIKRYTSAGTGPGQGGIPGHNLPLFVSRYAAATSPPMPTTVRPPLIPTFLATYAGAHLHMFKRTPLHATQKKEGGVFRNIGVWQRARYFSNDFECRDEILNVRNNVGMLDSSTLGKFRIFGPDALKALQRLYVSDMRNIVPGRIKYSAMCNDDGCVIDDGVVVKLADNDYYFTTSTGRAGNTVEWFRYHTRYDGWQYHMVNLTDAMGVINISGPNARKVLKKLLPYGISNKAFPYAAYREFNLKKTIPIRAMRLGFVGELSYELHVPSSYMQSVWDMLLEAGSEFGIKNFGLEAQNVLRMEKGHIILGQESEQRTNLLDLGLGFLWDRNKPEAKTIGAVALRQAENDPQRFKLVGIRMDDDTRAPRDGALIVDTRVRGYVATARKSFATGEAVGMALVESHLSKPGTPLDIYEDECHGNMLSARVIRMPFYDPEGKRMRM